METDLEQHPRADDLKFPLPDGWYLQEKEEYGDTVWFCQHPESMVTTGTHDSPETAAQYAHQEHQSKIDPDHELPWPLNGEAENGEAAGGDAGDAETEAAGDYDGTMVMGPAEDAAEEPEALEVLDEDEGEYVKVTPELKAQARHALNQVQGAILVTAYWVARIYDEQLYVGLGCNTKSQFVQNHLPFGERQAQRFARIGRRLGKFLPGHQDVDPDSLPEMEESEEGVPESLQGLPMGKLNELTRLDDEDLADYVEEGEWTAPDGRTYTREDVLEMARTDLGDVVSERTQRLKETAEQEKEKRQAYEELAAKRKEEKEALEEKLEEKAETIEAAEDLERRLGPTASKLEEKRKTMQEASDHLDEAIRLAGKIGITPEDPEADQENLQRFLQRAQRLKDVIHEDYAEVLINLGV